MAEVQKVDTELAPILERQRSELVVYVESVIPTVVKMEGREEVKDEVELGVVVAEGTAINRTKALIEQIRKTAKAPWLAGGQNVDDLVVPIRTRFEVAAIKGKQMIGAYHDKIAAVEAAEEAKRKAAVLAEEERRRKLQAAAKAKGQNVRDGITPVAPAVPIAHLAHRTPAKTTTTWKATLIDETRVSREFLMVDHVKANEAVRIWRRLVVAAEKAQTKLPPDLVIKGFEIKAHKDVSY